MWTIELPSGIYNFYLWKLSVNPKKRGSSKVGTSFFSQKITNMFVLVHSFGMQMVEFCEKHYIELYVTGVYSAILFSHIYLCYIFFKLRKSAMPKNDKVGHWSTTSWS